MEKYPEPMWAFFFGLIISSAWYVGRQVKKWDLSGVVALFFGIGIAYTITVISPAEGSTNLLYVAMSGLLAICALMLPGISGSFVLLLLGMYSVIIGSLKEILTGQGMDKIILILCFICGMVIGVMSFARVLTWMFKHYHMTTLAMLSGFMLGSLQKIWPWRVPTRWIDATGTLMTSGMPDAHARILSEKPVMPADYISGDPHTVLVVVAFILGFSLIFAANFFEKKLGAPQHMA
jgi:putative membrane protein